MEMQPSYRPMENLLPPPSHLIPADGPIAVPGMGAPQNSTTADEASIACGKELFAVNCQMRHEQTGDGNAPIAPFLGNRPANLTSSVLQSKSDGFIFVTITDDVAGKLPALHDNFTVFERWDAVDFIRTLKLAQ